MARTACLLPWLVLALALLPPGRPASAETRVLALEGPAEVTGLQRADVDGDGVADLLLLSGRQLQAWSRDPETKRVAAAPRYTWTIPEDVSFVSGPPLATREDRTPYVTLLGTRGARRVAADGTILEALAGARPLAWRDREGAAFANLDRAGGLVLPAEDGWHHAGGVTLAIPRFRRVVAPGPFLEDTCDVTHALPEVYVGAPAGAGEGTTLWAIAGGALVARSAAERTTYDIGFLGAGDGGEYDQTLVDLDGDRRPEILHRIFSNRQVHYGFFRTRPAKDGVGPSHKPADCRLSLQGFQLDPEFVDLDADGRLDLVITSMQVNAANMVGALSKGKVVAETRAFLNRSAAGDTFFVDAPDATVRSEIDVKVRFNQAGNVEVVRALMIVPDGDYDGDGRADLAIRTGPATVRVHPGRAAGVWAGEAEARTVAIPPMDSSPNVEGYAADLDGDGRDELVLVYRAPPGGRDRVRIVKP